MCKTFTHAQPHVKSWRVEKDRLRLLVLDRSNCCHSKVLLVVWSHFGFPASSGKIIEDRKSRKHVDSKLCPKILYTLEIHIP